MKTGKLLLLLACLLVAMSATAAAYEPTNEPALGFNMLETKIEMKEEVAISLYADCESLTISVARIPAEFPCVDEVSTNTSADKYPNIGSVNTKPFSLAM